MKINYKWSDSCKWLTKEDKEILKSIFLQEREYIDTFYYSFKWCGVVFCFEWKDHNIWSVTQLG